MSGRIAVAPCGHPGEYVIGDYIRCLSGCSEDSPAASSPSGHAWGSADPRGVQACARCDASRLWASGAFCYWRGLMVAGVQVHPSEPSCSGPGAP